MPYGDVSIQSFVLAALFGSNKHPDAPDTLYFALLRQTTFSPSDTLGTEPTIGVGSYARVSKANTDALWTITDETITTDVEVRWPVSTASWDSVALNQWAIFDAATAGVCWAFDALSANLTVSTAGREPVAAAGALTLFQDP